MDPFVELLKLILPAVVVFLTSFYLVKNFLDNESKKRLLELKIAGRELITPIRLQAYERVILFLERISTYSMVMRVNKQTFTSRQLHAELIATIRQEFEHNLSQQIYMSNMAWEMVKNAKEEMVQLVNLAAMKIPENAPSSELAQFLIENSSKIKVLPTSLAIDFIKKEIGQNF